MRSLLQLVNFGNIFVEICIKNARFTHYFRKIGLNIDKNKLIIYTLTEE